MVGRLLMRGMLAGGLAGLLAFAFAWRVGEPQVDLAIAFEDHVRQLAHAAAEPELISRAIQSTLGLFTGIMVYSIALGGIFALVYAYAQGRLGRLDARSTALLLAGAGWIALILAPQLKYPANPPSIGDPETIGARTRLYFGMIAISVVSALAALQVCRNALARLSAWNAALAGVGVYLLAMAVAMAVLPPVNEVPAGFLGVLLWKFRLVSLGVNAIVWLVIGLAFGALADPQLGPRPPRRLQAR